jgi:nucleoside-specific outer membrane channel protein Tsx
LKKTGAASLVLNTFLQATSKLLSLIAVFCAVLLAFSPLSVMAQGNHQLELLYSDTFDGRGRDDQMVFTYKQNNDWEIGDSFLFLDVAHLGNLENAGNFYFEWQPRLSLGKILSDGPLAFGPFEDIYLMGEFDHVHNKRVQKNTYLAGLSTNLAVPGFRFLKLALLARNDPTVSGHAPQLTMSWNYPFNLGGQAFSFEGFLDAAASEGTAPSYTIAQPQFLWSYNSSFKFGLEYNYWRNKGRVGFNETAWQLMARFTF